MKHYFARCAVICMALFWSVTVFGQTDPVIRHAGYPHQAETFCKLLKTTSVSVTAEAAITPLDNVATSTVASYYLPDRMEYPVLMRVQNNGDAYLRYCEYETIGTAGVTLPTSSSAIMLDTNGAIAKNSLAWEKVFYTAPNLTIAGSGTEEIVVEIWGRKGTE